MFSKSAFILLICHWLYKVKTSLRDTSGPPVRSRSIVQTFNRSRLVERTVYIVQASQDPHWQVTTLSVRTGWLGLKHQVTHWTTMWRSQKSREEIKRTGTKSLGQTAAWSSITGRGTVHAVHGVSAGITRNSRRAKSVLFHGPQILLMVY